MKSILYSFQIERRVLQIWRLIFEKISFQIADIFGRLLGSFLRKK